jgi:hypothetical protein
MLARVLPGVLHGKEVTRDLESQKLIVASILICALYGCVTAAGTTNGTAARYFISPQEAVILITEMLRREDWSTLSRYYDLSGSKVDRSELESGRFFARTKQPGGVHHEGFARYHHPFPPGFRFDQVRATEDPDVTVVVVSIEIDQGGSVKQRGVSEFKMRKSANGYQILPPLDR